MTQFLIALILIVQGANGAGQGPPCDAMEAEDVL